MAKKILRYLPLISTIILLLGIFNVHNFYNNFDIEIFHYLDVSEVLLSFTHLFNPIIAVAIFYLLFELGIEPLIRHLSGTLIDLKRKSDEYQTLTEAEKGIFNEEVDKYIIKHKVKPEKLKSETNKLKITLILSLVLVLIVEVKTIHLHFGLIDTNEILFDGPILLNIFLISSVLSTLFRPTGQVLNKKRAFQIFTVALFIHLVGYFFIRNDISRSNVMRGFPKYSATLNMGDRTITTNDSLVYIGSTRSFILLKNRYTLETTALPTAEMKSISLKKLREGL